MKYLDLAFDDPAHNLACDEALLQLVESGQVKDEILRVWEPAQYFVVLGHANSIHAEVNFSACQEDRVTVLRRMSGGGTVLQGPGCFNYSLFLNATHRFRTVKEGFRYVLERHKKIVQALTGREVALEGISDLAIGARKFSGNAQYRKSRAVLIHGTFLLDFDLSLIGRYLQLPSKQPAYRQNRSHVEFLMELPVRSAELCERLQESWNARSALDKIPTDRIEVLVRERYGRKEWSEKF
ncbi:MAG TPA: lipoate--protein ligase family protein [Phototrophicaceae bacterium]|nr:lipoate--protein ligase family protein [Phototrophicaceae bacterium]